MLVEDVMFDSCMLEIDVMMKTNNKGKEKLYCSGLDMYTL